MGNQGGLTNQPYVGKSTRDTPLPGVQWSPPGIGGARFTFFAKLVGCSKFFSWPMAGLTNQHPVWDSWAGAPLNGGWFDYSYLQNRRRFENFGYAPLFVVNNHNR